MKNILKKIAKSICMKRRVITLVLVDILVIVCANIISIMIVEDSFNIGSTRDVITFIGISLIAHEIFLLLFDVYNNITRYENGNNYLQYGFVCCIAFAATFMAILLFKSELFNIRRLVLASILIAVGIITYRVIIRFFLLEFDNKVEDIKEKSSNKKNLLLVGVNPATQEIIKAIHEGRINEYKIVGIVDEYKFRLKSNIAGIKIIGCITDVQDICEKFNVNNIFFTATDMEIAKKREVLNLCQETGAKVRVLNGTDNIIKGKEVSENLRDLNIEDVLCRDVIELDNNNINDLIHNNVVMVTGGGGSIGSELCRQIMKHSPKTLVIFDIYENNLYDIQMELNAEYGAAKIVALVGSVRDINRLEYIFNEYKPCLVFHAAAHKHVPLMEESPLEAIKNNVFGTYNIACMCEKYNVKKCVLISTDKAVNPTNVMGASKRICELIIQMKNENHITDFAAVRFGNVLGSNGSVIPLFKKQIEKGGPITVTDKRVTRFFMTIPEAVSLVLQAATYASGGEIFVLDMGQPVKIYDLAEKLIRLAGLEPNEDIRIDIVGLRPGEKLYEELLLSEEGLTTTKHKKIFIAKPNIIDNEKLNAKLDNLRTLISKEDCELEHVETQISTIVETYMPSRDIDGVTK